MKQVLILMLMCAALIVADKPREADEQDRKKLEGTWKFVVETHGDNDTSDEGKRCQFIFDGEKFTVKKDQEVLIEGTFKIDSSKSPARINLTITGDNEGQDRVGQESLAIYRFEGNQLKLCACEPSRGQRPEKFDTGGTDFVLVVMERSKK